MRPLLLALLLLVAAGAVLFVVSRFRAEEGAAFLPARERAEEAKIAPGRIAASSSSTARGVRETDGVRHSVPLDEIRQGCPGRDCIPSVDDPVFVAAREAESFLGEEDIGIGLVYKGEARFYPFSMLVTREIVNDTVAGDPLLITYCPLCGTGIVFSRRVGGAVREFGVSGLLWQSNLLMYDRRPAPEESSLWSQVLGEAVLGPQTGTALTPIPSDVVRWASWRAAHPATLVLNTGDTRDPYGGEYYGVARAFAPDFDEASSPLPPTAYVYGIEVNGSFKAYPKEAVQARGVISDEVGGEAIEVRAAKDGTVAVRTAQGEIIPDVEGFWFSWSAAHPETALYAP